MWRQMVGIIAACVVSFAIALSASAETESPEAQEMAHLFNRLCLQAFPNPAKFENQMTQLQAVPMSAGQLKTYLHQDQGQGWYYNSSMAKYVITVETSSVSACAIRRMTPEGFPSIESYIAAVKEYAAERNEALIKVPPQQAKTPQGADISGYELAIRPSEQQPVTDVFDLILTNYHGRYTGDLDNVKNTEAGVEVRFVHQIPASEK